MSTNFQAFLDVLSRPAFDSREERSLSPAFVALIVDRFLQYHPPSFNASSRRDLHNAVVKRYIDADQTPPSEVLAALDLGRVLAERSGNALARLIQKTGSDFTHDEETCVSYLQSRPSNIQLTSEQVSAAVTYTTITQSPPQDPTVLTAALVRILPKSFNWTDVVAGFDQPSARISSDQFLALYHALLPIAQDPKYEFNIQRLWGGGWTEPEAQLSFVSAYASLSPDQLDATTIPGLNRSITIEDYADSPPNVQERAAVAVRHPLVSVAALHAIFHVALNSLNASQSVEAKRLFQEVVVPNLDVFLVSSFEVPKQNWAPMAVETLNPLFENFLHKQSPEYDFVLDSLWRKDKTWVIQRLIDTHALKPIDLPLIFEHALKHNWLDDLFNLPNGFGIDLAAWAHGEGYLDLNQWSALNAERSTELARTLTAFLMIKADCETQYQRQSANGTPQQKVTTTLQVRTVSALLQILEDLLPKEPTSELINVQRNCITAYPRLINYGEGYDALIDTNGEDGNVLPQAANSKMEEHYKKMYGDEIQVRTIVEILDRYKRSMDPLDQDVFACMIHGLFDEYNHYVGYPLEALATTAVLFGGIISHKLIAELPLKVGLGMILEAVRDHMPDDPMYKFGLQALMQLLSRFREWPGFCRQLVRIPGLQGTEAYKKAEEICRDHEEEVRSRNGAGTPHRLGFPNESFPAGLTEDDAVAERSAPPFASINIDPPTPGVDFEDPADEAQGKIQFVLNNITETTIESMYSDLREMMEQKHQEWFASHIVEERARMQPNYHGVYLKLVKLFQDHILWSEVLRKTYICVARMLNSEATMQNATDRTQLKNLGNWLGLLTLARDRPIKHRNIAFKQLLIEAHDTKRLVVALPFVCKVLQSGYESAVFRPPNPWLMDIIHLLIELYHHAELKLNLKFEIEVLCKTLKLDHRSIEPSGEILNRPLVEESAEVLPLEQLEAFDSLSLNGLGAAVGGSISSQNIAPTLPDLGPLITLPPTSEMVVSTSRLHEIVRNALTRALQDIIQPVVDRSITIAAISTQQMIHKDFITEIDENRVRTSAVNMVKATAGSLALVTSKEPLRANFTTYMRNLSNDLPSGGLPEGTIIMCVNSNLDLACSIIEKQAEDRAVPEIEDMIEADLEARRRHRIQRPNEPFYESAVNRWAMTIPNPYKLSPGMNGLNPEQMSIYEDFARQPRNASNTAASHAASTSDATRSLANEVLQESYTAIPSIPTPAETPAVHNLGSNHMQPYAPIHGGSGSAAMPNGRGPSVQLDVRNMAERFNKLLQELIRVAGDSQEEHFMALPRPHALLDVVDALVQLIIKTSQNSEDFVIYATEQICALIFQPYEDALTLESLVHVLETIRKIGGPAVNSRVRAIFHQQPGSSFLTLPLLSALTRTDLLEWRNLDPAMSKALENRKEGSLEFLEQLLDLAILNTRPLALYADFVRTLEAAWAWVSEDSSSAICQRLRTKLIGPSMPDPSGVDEQAGLQQDQMEYVFEEWVHLCNNHNASEKIISFFAQQLQVRRLVRSRDDCFLFVRIAIDASVDRLEHILQAGGIGDVYVMIDALSKLITTFASIHSEGPSHSKVSFMESMLSLIALVLNHHHVKRGEHLNQRIFFRLLSNLLHDCISVAEDSDEDKQALLLKFASHFNACGPQHLPAFAFAWLSLIQHKAFMPLLLQLPNNAGWAPFLKLLGQLLDNLSEHLKAFNVSPVAKELYRATLKLLLVLHHDFPEFLMANHVALCSKIPPHCTQLLNVIVATTPQAGFNKERSEENAILAHEADAAINVLRECGLLNLLEQVVQHGPSEDTLAQVAHTMTYDNPTETTFGHVPVMANVRVISAIVIYLGQQATERANGGMVTVAGNEPDVLALSMLVHELQPEARYYLLSNMVNQLRFPNTQTEYYSQVILHIFGKDMNDPEDTEIRQEMTRVLLERLVGFWPQPWGLLTTVMELIKNEKYMFFELPFVKATPEVNTLFFLFPNIHDSSSNPFQVANQFAALAHRA